MREERESYQRRIDVLRTRNDLESSLGRRVNEFILAAFKANLFFYMDDHQESYDEMLRKYKAENQTAPKVTDEWVASEILSAKKLDMKADITSRKLKTLQVMLQSFQSNLSYVIGKFNLVS